MSSKPLPPLFPTVAASVASPINLTPWVGMACTLDGRDKITKVAAYSSRFLAFWYAASDPAAASKFGDLKAHLTMSRKAFRIGKFLNEIEKIRKLMARPTFDPLEGDEKDERVKPANALRTYQKALMILKCVGLGGFWVSENILLLTRGSSFLYRDDKDTQKSLAKTAQQVREGERAERSEASSVAWRMKPGSKLITGAVKHTVRSCSPPAYL